MNPEVIAASAGAAHPVWHYLLWACLAWYSTITIYIAYKGAADIKEMLRRLAQPEAQEVPEADEPPVKVRQ